jgi:hypothetical protein
LSSGAYGRLVWCGKGVRRLSFIGGYSLI